jgi:heme-degrading monooxygenase HmoA/uncharacterized damage-inducible protein DinB
MIARSWDGFTKAEQADAYADYIGRTGFKDLAATSGNRGVYVLRRREGDEARFRVLSFWDSMDGIRRFAGDDPERARYYPEDERFLKALDPHVTHFEVVAQRVPPAGGAEAMLLAGELETLVEGENWHGPALHELLDGVSAEAAASRPVPGAHTIWELVLHVTAWTDVFRRRLEGAAVEEPEAGDFPVPPPPTRSAWAEATQALFEGHRALTARVAALTDAELAAPIPGRPFDKRFQVRAAIRHIVYHSGQIGLLSKHCGDPHSHELRSEPDSLRRA